MRLYSAVVSRALSLGGQVIPWLVGLCLFGGACTGVVSNSDGVESFESQLTCLPQPPASPFEDSEPVAPPNPAECNPPLDNPGGINGTRGARQ